MITASRASAALALVTVLMAALCACSGPSARSLLRSIDDGAVLIGVKADQPGLGLRGADGAYSGFDIDVARYVLKAIAATRGKDEPRITWRESPTSQRENLIDNGEVDAIVATYSIDTDRAARVAFAGPYLTTRQGLLVRADDTSITGPDTLGTKKLCSVTGSTPAQKIHDQYPDVQLQEFGTYSECLPALLNGTIDAVTTDDTILAGFAAQEQYVGKLKLTGEPFTTEKYGVGLKKGDTALCTKVNDAIKKMVDDGAWKAAVEKTLGPAKYVPGPGNPPTPDACS